MDEIVNQVASKTGVDPATVQKVLHQAVELIKGRLPSQYASQVDSLLGGQSGGGLSGGGLGGVLGGLMGGTK